jgi:hypothetical protein
VQRTHLFVNVGRLRGFQFSSTRLLLRSYQPQIQALWLGAQWSIAGELCVLLVGFVIVEVSSRRSYLNDVHCVMVKTLRSPRVCVVE